MFTSVAIKEERREIEKRCISDFAICFSSCQEANSMKKIQFVFCDTEKNFLLILLQKKITLASVLPTDTPLVFFKQSLSSRMVFFYYYYFALCHILCCLYTDMEYLSIIGYLKMLFCSFFLSRFIFLSLCRSVDDKVHSGRIQPNVPSATTTPVRWNTSGQPAIIRWQFTLEGDGCNRRNLLH